MIMARTILIKISFLVTTLVGSMKKESVISTDTR